MIHTIQQIQTEHELTLAALALFYLAWQSSAGCEAMREMEEELKQQQQGCQMSRQALIRLQRELAGAMGGLLP